MRINRRTGTTLIEILVVIVVFLVGILAIVQIFPPGLNLLRISANNTVAAQFAATEAGRILSRSGQLPEMIVPVTYRATGTGNNILIDTSRNLSDLMPPKDPGNLPGQIDANGNVIVGGQSIGDWQRVSGSNLINRVIGESGQVPAPRQVPGVANGFGGVYNMTFGPAYYFPQLSGIGEDGVVQVYGNDFVRRFGDREFNQPNPRGRWRENEFFFVPASSTLQGEFQDEDQIWIAPNLARKYRIAFSFAYDNNGRTDQYDVIIQANLDPNNIPPYAMQVNNYWLVSLERLVAEQDIYGGTIFDPAKFKFAEFSSIRLQRVFQEVPVAQSFNQGDPYEYKVLGTGTLANNNGFCIGTLLFNPTGFGTRVRSNQSSNEALQARVDYFVYDWRLIKDEFRVPRVDVVGAEMVPKEVKLSLNGIKPLGSAGPDNRAYMGAGLDTPTLRAMLTGQTEDVVVIDTDSGAVILGNQVNDPNNGGYPQFPDSSWSVDKSLGQILFRDVDGDASNGLSAYLSFPTGDPADPWSARQLVPDITNRAVRVIYQGRGEWSVQPLKAARTYRVAGLIGAQGLTPGECFVGGTPDSGGNPVGQNHRLYFAPFDLGQKVIVGEMWVTQNGSQPFALYDQEIQISGVENVGGVDLAYAETWDKVPNGAFDASQGYSIRRVKGASLKVRVMWNPTSFILGLDPIKNYEELEVWMRSWRRTDNETLQIGGRH